MDKKTKSSNKKTNKKSTSTVSRKKTITAATIFNSRQGTEMAVISCLFSNTISSTLPTECKG